MLPNTEDCKWPGRLQSYTSHWLQWGLWDGKIHDVIAACVGVRDRQVMNTSSVVEVAPNKRGHLRHKKTNNVPNQTD